MPCWLPWKQWQDLNVTLFFFFFCLGCSRRQPHQGSILCSGLCGWPSITSALLFCHSAKRFSRYLRAGGWSCSKASLWKGTCSDSLQQQHRGSNFHLSFHGTPREGKHKSLKTLALACIHNTSGKKPLCTWMSGAMGSDTPSHSPGDPSSACSMMQLTSTTSSVYPQYCSVATKPDLDCLRRAQVKPWHQCHL